MSAAAAKELLHRRPFEPFLVRLSSGDTYEVRPPEMALHLCNGMYIAVPQSNGSQQGDELPDRAVWCSLLHVAALEPLGSGNSQ